MISMQATVVRSIRHLPVANWVHISIPRAALQLPGGRQLRNGWSAARQWSDGSQRLVEKRGLVFGQLSLCTCEWLTACHIEHVHVQRRPIRLMGTALAWTRALFHLTPDVKRPDSIKPASAYGS
jgi:hypothetical protein